jgi:hypothetical protein
MKNSVPRLIRILIAIVLLFTVTVITISSTNDVSADLQRYELYNASWFDTQNCCDNFWLGQTFTAISDHTVNQLKIYFSRNICFGSAPCEPGIIHAVIKNVTSNGSPYGPALCSGSIDGNNLPVGYSWQMINMSEYNLTAGYRYAIILYNAEPCATGPFGWLIEDGNPYHGGNLIQSNDSGNTWTANNDFDFNFEVWGGPVIPLSGGGNNPLTDSSSSNSGTVSVSTTPNITVLNITSTPANAIAGQPINIMANVVNRGELPGSYDVVLRVNDNIENTKQVIVPGNEAVPVEFTVYKDTPGNYTIDIDGQKTYFSITGQHKGNGVDGTTIAYILMGILVFTTIIVLIRYLTTR